MLRRVITALLIFSPAVAAASPAFQSLYEWQTTDHDWNPETPPLVENGVMYGTIEYNASGFENPNDKGCGGYGCGSVYRLRNGVLTFLHKFTGPDGGMPIAGVIKSGHTLFGTTSYGGPTCKVTPEHCGTIYSLDLQTGKLTTLHGFSGRADGGGPYGKPLLYGSMLYGTTAVGGKNCGAQGCGTIFRLDPATGAFATLYRFSASDETAFPESALTPAGQAMFGTTAGFFHAGSVFRFDVMTGQVTILHRFRGGSDGTDPSSDLVLSGDALYGTTRLGGTGGACGTVFKLDLATFQESILHTFTYGFDGAYPSGALAVHDGQLYGTATVIYRSEFPFEDLDEGSVYQIDLATGSKTTLFDFSGQGTQAGLPGGIVYSDGALYGVTGAGGNTYPIIDNYFVTLGVAFSLTP
jgi:uncharacterized repeat protein (TIGR03803 family)